ncbi:hypothetical protein V1477_017244 [Vespula maculifrons]|uniref:Uncharacterized protein n=1 Tax=Vespula maculifrons TaxID=7453 RepID=A0ABD2B5Q8_VESMC
MQQPPRGGTWVGDTCRYIKILWDTSIIEQMAVCFNEFSKVFSMLDHRRTDHREINFYREVLIVIAGPIVVGFLHGS